MSVAPARRAALTVLRRVRERGAFGPETLDAVLQAGGLSAQDTALATRLTYGTLQTLGTLDEALEPLLTHPNAVEPEVRDALRLAAYEILFARTPARAAVNEGVEAVKAVRKQAAGMANAVLRRLAVVAPSFPWGDPDTDDDALARATAHPRWIVDLWIRESGRERAMEALRSGLEPAPLYLWHVPFKGPMVEALDMLAADGAEPVTDIPPGCIRAGNAQAAVRGRAVGEGRVLVTDAAAQLAALACGAHPGGVVIDVAAGRGTKTVQIQALAVASGEAAAIYAIDLHRFKMDVVCRRMRDLGVPGVTTVVGDATDLAAVEGIPAPGTADAALLDAPCTGLGSLRRRPEKRWRVTAEDGVRLAALQGRMLSETASLVRLGGRVVYSTCTVNRAENHDVVAGFLEQAGGGFSTADITHAVPGEWGADVGPEGWFQSEPRSGGPDGHFVAALTRVR